MVLSRDEMMTKLRAGECTIEFVKLDGTDRVMKATLEEGVIPIVRHSTTKEENLVVFDTEKQGWRTVIIERIKNFSG